MATPVKLYVYDLSNGMARQLSLQLTGRQIDGIWHTSVVVYGKEFWYGHGIDIASPGQSHYGSPVQILDMGETSIDAETFFDEYLTGMREHYTADKYHLLEFNCNSFTSDCIGFLTGRAIPSFITDLPQDFLTTPFGAALRPTIDAMYRRPVAVPSAEEPVIASNASPDSQFTASIHQAGPSGVARPSLQNSTSLTSPMHIITNSSSFQSFLKSHRAAVAFFTSATCGPCRMIEPIFDRLSEEKGISSDRNGAGFAKIDIGVGLSRNLAIEWSVRATPTFMFFLDGNKIAEVKGADAKELRTHVDLLLFQAYPPHPHTRLSLPAVQALSLMPIIFSQVPAFDVVFSKLSTFIDDAAWPTSMPQSQAQVKQDILSNVLPYLKSRFGNMSGGCPPNATPSLLSTWTKATVTLVAVLPVDALFPIVDTWRLAFLDGAVGTWCASCPSVSDPISILLPMAVDALRALVKSSRNCVLTVLRLLCNSFTSPDYSKRLMSNILLPQVTSVIVSGLLHQDASVRIATASLAFNVSAYLQKGRVEAVRNEKIPISEDDDWNIEMVSAIVEAIDREKENEEVVHRLTASLAFLLRLSPSYDSQLKPLLEVLQIKKILRGKLVTSPHWERGVEKKDNRKLIQEVADMLCP